MRNFSYILLGALMATLMCFGPRAHSQTATSTAQAEREIEKAWGLEVSTSQNSNLQQRSDDEYDTYTDFLVAGTYQTRYATLGARLGASQSWVDDREFKVADSRLDATAPVLDLGTGFSQINIFRVTLPTSKESRVERSLRASIAVVPTLSFDFGAAGLRGLNLAYSLSLARNIHRYTTAADGASNNQWGVSNIFAVNLKIFSRLGLSATAYQRNNFTYTGYLVQNFRHDEEISFDLTKKLTVAAGHTNEGSALRPNGQDEASVFDRNKSEVYLSLSATF